MSSRSMKDSSLMANTGRMQRMDEFGLRGGAEMGSTYIRTSHPSRELGFCSDRILNTESLTCSFFVFNLWAGWAKTDPKEMAVLPAMTLEESCSEFEEYF